MGELALLVPLAPFIMVCFIVWTKHRRRMAELQMLNMADATLSSDKVRELENRVRVLEAIVTDKGFDLAGQIEALRDRQPEGPRMIETGSPLDN